MNYVDHLNNFEIFKMANELAVNIYPNAPIEKEEREMLIDFKDVLRKTLKSKSKIISHDRANVLLKFMNPKRKWPWERLETLNYIYEIEPNFDVFSNLLDASGIDVSDSNEELIFKYLIISEIYDRSVLKFLYEVYDLKLPELSDPFDYTVDVLYTDDDIKAAKKVLKSGNFKPSNTPILLKKNIKIVSDDIDDDIEDILGDDLDIDDIDIDIDDIDLDDDLDDIDIDDDLDLGEDFDDDDFNDDFNPSKAEKKNKKK